MLHTAGCQRVGQLRELGGRIRCTPPSRVARGFLERGGDALVGAVRGKREVANATLLVVDHVGQPPVRIASFAVRCHPCHRRGEQWVREPHHASVDLDDPSASPTVDGALPAVSECPGQSVLARVSQKGGKQKRLAGGSRELARPLHEERAQVAGNGEGLSGARE